MASSSKYYNRTYGRSDRGFNFWFDMTETAVAPSNNTSTVTVKFNGSPADTYAGYEGNSFTYFRLKVNGSYVVGWTNVSDFNPGQNVTQTLIQKTGIVVQHDADGSKTLEVVGEYTRNKTKATGSGGVSYSNYIPYGGSGDYDADFTFTRTFELADLTAPTITVSLASRSANSLTVSATASSSCDIWQYKVGSGSWTQFSTTDATAATCTISGLSPSTTYAVQIRVRKTSNQVYGTSASASYTTLGAATLNSVQDFYADATTVSIALSTEVYNASYTYSLAIKNGNSTYLTITGLSAKPVGTQNYSITLTSSQRTTLLNAMANVASFSATFVLTSLNNSTTIGTSSTTATISTSATTSAPNAPTFNFADTNASTVAVTGNNQALIQGQSSLTISSLSATAKNGATIANYNITVGGVTVTSTSGGTVAVGTVSQSGTLACKVTVTDSRGYTNSTTKNITCYSYNLPEVTTAYAMRDAIDTDYVGLTFSGTYSAVGSNTVTAKYKYKKTSEENYSADTPLTITVGGGAFSFSNSHIVDFDSDSSYDFVLTVSDSLNTEVYNMVVSSYEPLIAYRIDGVGINKVPRAGYSVDVKGTIGVGEITSPDPTYPHMFLGTNGDGELQYMNGAVSGGLFDAEYHPDTSEITLWADFATPVEFDYTELTSILSIGTDSESEFLDKVYPVGSIYMSVNSTNPGTLFGGTWEQIQDTFLLAAGSTYAAGSTGGEAEHTLTTAEMPSHSHVVTRATTSYASGQQSSWRALSWSGTNHDYSDVVSSESSGSGNAHNNMPPYLAIFVWKRTA